MKSFIFAVVLLSSGMVWSGTDCNVPVSKWQSRDVLRSQLELKGMQVQRIKVDDGCYEVRGIDAEGNNFKAKYSPDNLLVLKMKVKKGGQSKSKNRNKKK